MSRPNCSTCPIDRPMSDSEATRFCGDPTVRCVNFRGLLERKVDSWQRFSAISELARGGKLPISVFRETETISIITGLPGVGYGTQNGTDRIFSISVIRSEDDTLVGKVVRDSYLDLPIENDCYQWAVPLGEEVVINGASDRGDNKRPGELVIGLNFEYDWRGNNRWGGYVQEVQLSDGLSNSFGDVFATDPTVYRSAPLN